MSLVRTPTAIGGREPKDVMALKDVVWGRAGQVPVIFKFAQKKLRLETWTDSEAAAAPAGPGPMGWRRYGWSRLKCFNSSYLYFIFWCRGL